MKRLLLSLPLVLVLSACSSGSGSNNGPEVDYEKAQDTYTSIRVASQAQTNFVVDYNYSSTKTNKIDKNQVTNKSNLHYEYTTFGGHQLVKGSQETKDASGTSKISIDYRYTMSDAGALVTYRKETFADGKTEKSTDPGAIPSPYLEICAMIEGYIHIQDYLSRLDSLTSNLQTSVVASNNYKTTYYSKDETSLTIITDLPLQGVGSETTQQGHGEIVFENNYMKKFEYSYTVEDGGRKETTTSLYSFSYPQKMTISLPSDWNK